MKRLCVLIAVVAVAGCGDEPKQDAELIEDWVGEVSDGDYVAAAAHFAPGAIIDQGEPIRLRNREAAEAFNRGLPCRADLTEVKDEGRTTLASFRLRRGPGGPCNGIVQVRFTIRDEKFVRWIQLPGPGVPPGTEA